MGCLGSSASKSTDLYALAALAYEMLLGRPPFEAETPLAVLHQHVTRMVPALSRRVAGLPPRVDEVMDRALSKEAGRRHPSCGEFARDLATALERPAVSDAALTATAVPPPSTPVAASRRPGRILGMLGIAALVFAVIVIGPRLFSPRPAEDRQPAALPDASAESPSVDETVAENPSTPPPTEPRWLTSGAELTSKRLAQQLRRPRALSEADFLALGEFEIIGDGIQQLEEKLIECQDENHVLYNWIRDYRNQIEALEESNEQLKSMLSYMEAEVQDE